MLANKIHMASVDSLVGGGGAAPVLDNFNRASLGADWGISGVPGTQPTISADRLLMYAEVGMANFARWLFDLGSNNHFIEADYLADSVIESTSMHQLLLRFHATNTTYYGAGWENQNSRWVIQRVLNGASTNVAVSGALAAPTTDLHLRFEVEGTALRFYIDDTLTLSGTNAELASPGRVGFRSAQRSAYFDNFNAGIL